MILQNGYRVEIHRVETPDGYLLTLFRIPGEPGSTPVYYQHGLLDSSDSFVAMGKNKSLGFLLHDEGFDGWAGNFRGNDYSFINKNYDIDSPKYWDFSWDTLGERDVRIMIDYILEQTGSPQLIYIGHSMGTTSFNVAASRFPDVNEKVKAYIALAPVTTFQYSRSPIFTTPFLGQLFQALQQYPDGSTDGLNKTHSNSLPFNLPDFTTVGNFAELFLNALGHGEIKGVISRRYCTSNYVSLRLCLGQLSAIVGNDEKNLTPELEQLIFLITPKSSSLKMVKHYLQQRDAGHLFLYDYGSEENNMQVYNSPTPPEADFANITCPTFFVYGQNDLLTAEGDVRAAYSRLGNGRELIAVPRATWNHDDFLVTQGIETILHRGIILPIVNQFK
ncbi:lipase 1-like [Bemisia tabaci]|uniref:lipase 1-like n=1 Tax=Bemisia tabaci TaxID=7038 RepID=UPI003B286438